jgi:hypothetical protein
MRKGKWFGLCGVVALLIGAGLATLVVALKHEPNFYHESQVAPGEGRRYLANECLAKFGQMTKDSDAGLEKWGCDTSEAQLNSFFAEIFPQLGEGENLHSLGIGPPVLTLDDDQMRLAFRYGSGWFSTVVSYELKIWLVSKEPNVVAVEIVNARAGAVPISNQSILQQLSEYGRKQNKKVNLYRHEGHSVAVIGLQAEQDPHPKWILTCVHVERDHLKIRGKTPDYALRPVEPRPVEPGKAVTPAAP